MESGNKGWGTQKIIIPNQNKYSKSETIKSTSDSYSEENLEKEESFLNNNPQEKEAQIEKKKSDSVPSLDSLNQTIKSYYFNDNSSKKVKPLRINASRVEKPIEEKIGSIPKGTFPGTTFTHLTYGKLIFEKFYDFGLSAVYVIDTLGARHKISNTHFIIEKSKPKEPVSEYLTKPIPDVMNTNFFESDAKVVCSVNFYQTGVNNGETFIKYLDRTFVENINELSNVADDVIFIIPKDFCRSQKYNDSAVLEYFKFIQSLDLAEITMKEGEIPYFAEWKNDSWRNPLVNNEAYIFYIKSEHPEYKYLVIEMLRCLYTYGLSNVPGIFLQARRELCSEGLNDYQVFLLSCLFQKTGRSGYLLFSPLSRAESLYGSGYLLPNILSLNNTVEKLKENLVKISKKRTCLLSLSYIPENILELTSSKQLKQFYNNYKTLFL